ncbi:hypothetical protein AO284_23300 [Pseudomonas sp. NZIPFR-PS2]|nr:hypothetical protein AO284_23300 [Pseudomonas sp. NZIPFR-PS2]
MFRRACTGLGDQPQQRRVQGIDPSGEAGVVAVHGQGVLGQVIGADGQEVRMLGQVFGHQRSGGHFDHHPQFGALGQLQLHAQLIQALADLQQLIHFADHRQ